MKFIADVMVGKLARWLRILGYDVLYSNQFKDNEILQIAKAEERVVLTRDVELHRRAGARAILVAHGDYNEQVRQVIAECGLNNFAVLSRCAECNTRLVGADRESVFLKVPPFVYLTQERFAECPTCERVYWHGTHTKEMFEKVERMLSKSV
jgi:uncharacterized protein